MSFQGDIVGYKTKILKYGAFDRLNDGEFWESFESFSEEYEYRKSLTDSEAFDKLMFSEDDALSFLSIVFDKLEELEGEVNG